ncbi:MAG: phosphatase PAP2 family protein [Candidatus Acidiferrales bacterium]|jgi:undecaprenyl-diphosphatase
MTVTRVVWNFIEDRDHRLMRRVHRWRAPRWIRIWMISATRLGDGWCWYALGVLLLIFGGPHRFAAIGAAGSAAVTGIFLFRALKKASHRKRPCELHPHCWAMVLPPDQFSFPSGHSITAFGVAIAVALFYPELLGVLLLIATSIALSRIVLGMHFLSDVLVGSLMGALLGAAFFSLFR